MFIIFQIFCIFIGVLAICMFPQALKNLVKYPSMESLIDFSFTVLTFIACLVIVGILEITTTGIF